MLRLCFPYLIVGFALLPSLLMSQDIKVNVIDSTQLKPDIEILNLLNSNSPFAKKSTNHDPKLKDFIKSSDKFVFDDEIQLLWVIRDNFLIVTDFNDSARQSKIIHKAREPFVDIARTDDGVFVHTRSTVLRFNDSMRLIQAIPVKGDSRSLLKFQMSSTVHSYLFTDNVLEIYNLSDQTITQTAIDSQYTVEQMVMLQNYLVLLMKDGEIKALKLW